MYKKLLLLSTSLFTSIVLLAQNNVKSKPDKFLNKYTEGAYEISTFYTTADNTYTYEISKDKKIIFSETILPQKGSNLGYMTKDQLREEIMKIAKFVLKHEKENPNSITKTN